MSVVIVGAARSPFGKFGGALRDATHSDLGGAVYAEAINRSGIESQEVNELVAGVNLPGADRSIARQISLKAGLPDDKVAYTVDRACCSSLAAISLAARSIRLGDAAVGIAGGCENMSRVPYFLTHQRWGSRLGDVVLSDQLVIACPMTGKPRAVQAGEEAVAYGVGRVEQDTWALRSHHRYFKAFEAGCFDDEIVEIDLPGEGLENTRLTSDESPRRDATLEKLAALSTIYGSPTVTAGNAPGLGTGASAVVLTTEAHARRRALTPLGRIEATAMASGHPDRIASIPAEAARKALDRAGMKLSEMDLIEINEAFAAVPLVTTRIMANETEMNADQIRERTNVNGGAIAMGHPTGATGARLVITLLHELRRRREAKGQERRYFGLATLCGGLGEAEAMIVSVP